MGERSIEKKICSCSNTQSIRNDFYMTYRENSLEQVELIKEVSLVLVFFHSNTGSLRDDPYWTGRKNRVELIKLFSSDAVSSVQISLRR